MSSNAGPDLAADFAKVERDPDGKSLADRLAELDQFSAQARGRPGVRAFMHAEGKEEQYELEDSNDEGAGLQTNLSKFKLSFRAPEEFKKKLHMSKEDMNILAKEKQGSMRKKSIDIQAIDGDNTVLDCRELLQSPDFSMKVIAVACLTGRRMAEIIVSAKFDPPSEEHATDARYCYTA